MIGETLEVAPMWSAFDPTKCFGCIHHFWHYAQYFSDSTQLSAMRCRGRPFVCEKYQLKQRVKLTRARHVPNINVYLGKAFALWSKTKAAIGAKNGAAFAKVLLDRFVF